MQVLLLLQLQLLMLLIVTVVEIGAQRHTQSTQHTSPLTSVQLR